MHRRSKRTKRKRIHRSFKKSVRKQKRRSKKYNSYRVARGGIRL